MSAVGELSSVAPSDPLDEDPRLEEYFGAAWGAVLRFHDLLVDQGQVRGLIGPREQGRLWERHLLNSAAVVPFLDGCDSVVDLGSGAGLPGVVIAAMMPRSSVVLLEPMERRATWLNEVIAELGLTNATVTRARAEEVATTLRASAVTARAVGPLERLYRWASPLLAPGGRLVALKGLKAADEVVAARSHARSSALGDVKVVAAPTLAGVEPTTVVLAYRQKNGE
jgi:16S rRNA (guanine527-N7)-methyltransferase